MNNIYTYFQSKKIICKDSNDIKKTNITSFSSLYSSKSILLKYKNLIYKLAKELELDTNYNAYNDKLIIDLDSDFNKLLKNKDINEFCNNLFNKKSQLSSKTNFKTNLKKLLNINDKNKEEIILNPLYNTISVNTSRTNLKNFINNTNKNNINIDILSQGKFIHLNYPTLGIIHNDNTISQVFYTNISTSTLTIKHNSITNFFSNILNYIYNHFDDQPSNYFYLPLQAIDFGSTICKILGNKNLNALSSIRDYINTTDLSMFNLMTYIEPTRKNKKKSILLLDKFIIPYEIVNDKIKKMSIQKINKYTKNYKKYFEEEKKVYDFVYNTLKISRNKINKSQLNDFYNLMYLFCYRNILIFYDAYWIYINKRVNYYVLSLKISDNKIFKNLNYDNFIDYIDKLNQSLLITKKILLNNLYKIFRPNIIGKDYGIVFEDNYGTIPLMNEKTLFLGKNIFNKLTSSFCSDISNNYAASNLNDVYNLFTNFEKNDIYNQDIELFVGVSFNNNENLNASLGLLNIDEKKFKIQKKFNLKIIQIIIKIFKNCIPIELLTSILDKKNYLLHSSLSNKDKNNLKNYIVKEFKNYLKESTELIISTKKMHKEEIPKIILKSKINYNISYFIYRIVQISIHDVELKNQIIYEIEKIKNVYLQIIKQKLK